MLDEPKTLRDLLHQDDPKVADFARDFLALYTRLYGGDGPPKAEAVWQQLVDAKVTSGYGIEGAQTRAIQELRVTIGAAEKKNGLGRIFDGLGRIFGGKG
jgi:hypothetical protein